MTPADRRRAQLEAIRAQLEDRRAALALKLYTMYSREVAPATVQRVFRGHDHRITTLVDIADLLDADVEIRIVPRQ